LEPKETYTYLYGYCVYNQLQNKNLRCQWKQMHGNYFRITAALCHLTVVLRVSILTPVDAIIKHLSGNILE